MTSVASGGQSAELMVEALLVASAEPVQETAIAEALPGIDLEEVFSRLQGFWSRRGVNMVRKGGMVSMQPCPRVAEALAEAEGARSRKLSDAAVETLSFIALNQPVSAADIERGRGVKLFRGLMESLIDAGLVRASIRRTDSGRAVSYVTTDAFLERFGLTALSDLPTPEELPEIAGWVQAENDDPHPQDDVAWGLSNLNDSPARPETQSSRAPER